MTERCSFVSQCGDHVCGQSELIEGAVAEWEWGEKRGRGENSREPRLEEEGEWRVGMGINHP